jgi:hypothetical protein
MGMYQHPRPPKAKYSLRDGLTLPEAKLNKFHNMLIGMPVGSTLIVRDPNFFPIFRQACFELNGKMMIYYPTYRYEQDKKIMAISKLGITDTRLMQDLVNKFTP